MRNIGTVTFQAPPKRGEPCTHCDECGYNFFINDQATLFVDSKGQLRLKCLDEKDCKRRQLGLE